MQRTLRQQDHSSAWIVQTWAAFIISVSSTGLGILYLPVNGWVKGFLGMGLIFTVSSTVSVSKTTRDVHESKKFTSRIDEARMEKILSEQNTL